MLEIYIDGASRGNPGPASAGISIFEGAKKIKEEAVFLGKNTNNFAEYVALIIGLQEALKQNEKRIRVFSDSVLLVNQIKGRFKIKSDTLFALSKIVKNLLPSFEEFDICYIPRKKNKDADKLANKALEERGL